MPDSRNSQAEPGWLVGQLLVAMPQMGDPRFERTVIYMCAHTKDGAMGVVVNRLLEDLTFRDLLKQLDVDSGAINDQIRVHFGGPVESGRGFVLHSDDFVQDSSMVVGTGIAMTATLDILRAIATGAGPRQHLLALGYAGWGPGQLESELQANGWLTVPADASLVFNADDDRKWTAALATLGISPSALSGEAGHA